MFGEGRCCVLPTSVYSVEHVEISKILWRFGTPRNFFVVEKYPLAVFLHMSDVVSRCGVVANVTDKTKELILARPVVH